MVSGEELRTALVAHLRRAGHVRSEPVAAAFGAVPRELFLAGPAELHGLAAVYEDEAVVTRRAADGTPESSSSQPGIMAEMLEMLALRPGARVLEVGAGTGYNAALLARLVGEGGAVTSVELDADLAAGARAALRAAGSPAQVVVGDGHDGWPAAAPVDAVVVTASTDAVPRAWHDQLAPGGLLVLPLQLAAGALVLQAVVAVRKVRQGFLSLAHFWIGWHSASLLRHIAGIDRSVTFDPLRDRAGCLFSTSSRSHRQPRHVGRNVTGQ